VRIPRYVPIDGGWLEIDTPHDLKLYRDRFEAGAVATRVALDES